MHYHSYKTTIVWTGNTGEGTTSYHAYKREHTIKIEDKADLFGSSDAAFNGDKERHNPEDMLISSIAACHMLWYLHLCSQAGVVVVDYIDNATGVMEEERSGKGRFLEVTLRPTVAVTNAMMKEAAIMLHEEANKLCFIANSVNFPIKHEPTIVVKQE